MSDDVLTIKISHIKCAALRRALIAVGYPLLTAFHIFGLVTIGVIKAAISGQVTLLKSARKVW